MKFSELGLTEPFLRATNAAGYETATPIQAQAIPAVLAGRDVVGCAQTGTGKTAAFTLPLLDRLLQSLPPRPQDANAKHNRRSSPKGAKPNPRVLRALILTPTRELAAQVEDSLKRYGRFTPLRQTVVYGGVSQFHQVKALRHGVDALVATPGRLLDLMEQGHIDLSRVEILVLDEADQMMDMGFIPALKRIIAAVPQERQTLMFSATMPDQIRRLAQQWLRQPVGVEVARVATPAERISQSVHLVDKKRKPDLLAWFLQASPRSRTLVFSRTKHGADKIVKRLKSEGLRAEAIHGNKSQAARTRTLARFKSKNPPVLVATDIAARGLDINEVSHVVNFDLPETPETYVHRIGRTARAGAEGVAVSFCAGDERGLLKQIERLINVAIEVEPAVAGFEPTESARPNQNSRRNRRADDSSASSTRPPRRKPRRASAKKSQGSTFGERSTQGGTKQGGSDRRRKRRNGEAAGQVASNKRQRRNHVAK